MQFLCLLWPFGGERPPASQSVPWIPLKLHTDEKEEPIGTGKRMFARAGAEQSIFVHRRLLMAQRALNMVAERLAPSSLSHAAR